MTKKLTPDKHKKATPKKLECGIVMPISSLDGCSEAHWLDVREIIEDAVYSAGFEPHLVSDADDVGIIQARIIQNLYNNPIVVCDVSGKNPNVMFELGLRLAFDKPTVIMKDDKTAYTFDTASIEHLEYPRDLRFARIVDFKEQLADKLKGTYKKATEDSSYTTFLKRFGSFSSAKLEGKGISNEEFLLEEIQSVKRLLLARGMSSSTPDNPRQREMVVCLHGVTNRQIDELVEKLRRLTDSSIVVEQRNQGHYHLPIDSIRGVPTQVLLKICRSYSKDARIISSRPR